MRIKEAISMECNFTTRTDIVNARRLDLRI
ncbi:hypothetical protein PENSTE_c018G00736 [Penicillium steckii]|uniref:Uncharacterized protein n=1 Tax=Penicillium steckii TaxID=303698 RepID=A0A1V6SWY6_9EURO|nr:hypothetical protein PENSTE_c018G00736 [Penicillium steckii]